MLVEGTRLCGECTSSDIEIEFGFVTDEFDLPQEITFPLFSVSEKLLGSVADTKNPQSIVLIAKRPKQKKIEDLFEAFNESLPLVVYLYRINNPSNLGAVIRTAEAAGVAGVLTSGNSADAFSPKSLRASMGSAFRLPIVTNVEIENVIAAAHENDMRVAAVDLSGDVRHTEFDWKRKSVLVFGSEADGLPDEIVSMADAKLEIEMKSEVESLNLAVSCGIVLFEARRQLTGWRSRSR
jgi:TrmH family RNA methyltransferase